MVPGQFKSFCHFQCPVDKFRSCSSKEEKGVSGRGAVGRERVSLAELVSFLFCSLYKRHDRISFSLESKSCYQIGFSLSHTLHMQIVGEFVHSICSFFFSMLMSLS